MAVFVWVPTRAELGRVVSEYAGLQTWRLSFEQTEPAYALLIDAFLEARRAAQFEKFDWTNKMGQTKQFVCRAWSLADAEGRTVSVSAEFQEVPAAYPNWA